MKREAREQARSLRHQGYSIKQICQQLGVAKSSVSLWVRDIPLTEAQLADLKQRHPIFHGQYAGSQAIAAKHRALREQYQQEGRIKAREGDLLHQAGCMLYWGEGAKARNMLTLCNSDPDMIRFYMRFVRHTFTPDLEKFAVHISCYLGNGFSQDQVEQYWLELLELPATCLGKTSVNSQPISSQQKGRKLLYGVCTVRISSTRMVQHVLGAIQEYIGIDKPEWLL
jgi:transposase-like protein